MLEGEPVQDRESSRNVLRAVGDSRYVLDTAWRVCDYVGHVVFLAIGCFALVVVIAGPHRPSFWKAAGILVIAVLFVGVGLRGLLIRRSVYIDIGLGRIEIEKRAIGHRWEKLRPLEEFVAITVRTFKHGSDVTAVSRGHWWKDVTLVTVKKRGLAEQVAQEVAALTGIPYCAEEPWWQAIARVFAARIGR